MIEIENIGKEANVVTRRIPEDTTASCDNIINNFKRSL